MSVGELQPEIVFRIFGAVFFHPNSSRVRAKRYPQMLSFTKEAVVRAIGFLSTRALSGFHLRFSNARVSDPFIPGRGVL
jgi:hypothetical protein